MTGRLPLLGGVALGLVLTAGCTAGRDPSPASGLRLVAFTSCEDVLGKLRQAAKEYVGPYGFAVGGDVTYLNNSGVAAERAAGGAAAPGAADDRALAPDSAAKAGADYSGTNTHEAGVDEPDLVKTDGRRIVTVSRGVLRVVDAATKQVTGKLNLTSSPDSAGEDPVRWGSADLLLSGDRALVLTSEAYQYRGRVAPEGDAVVTGPRLLLVDLSGGDPRVVSSYTMDGNLVDARQVGATARVVIRSGPRLLFPLAEGKDEGANAVAANKAVVDKAGLDDWLPRYAVTTDGRTERGRVGCGSVSSPAKVTGTSMMTVLSFDLGAPKLGDGSPVTVVADGETVYSNGPSLYVANDQRWRAVPIPVPGAARKPRQVDQNTEIYKFDTSGSGRPRYVAGGSVPGWLINQYALSEWDGHLRVATTSSNSNESTVYVLRQDGKSLKQTGKVGGLGKGERIYAVRFAGSTGYVVTFKQTDPLYTVDLSDPAKPRVAGELKITGYSAYLHPAGDGRLIGIGQEASTEGRVQGTQISLFDVSNLEQPKRLAQHHVKYGNSEAEFDPHAFLYWPADRLLVVPMTAAGASGGVPASGGALVLRVGDDSLTEVGMVTQQANDLIRRALVINGALWTVSDTGLQASNMSTLDRTAWVALT